MRSLTLALLGAVLTLSSGCKPNEFVCSLDRECTTSGGGSGRCLAGHCAYVDTACPSGWRFDDTGGNVADQCVDPALLLRPDAAVPDAPPQAIDVLAPPIDVIAPPVDAAPPDAAPPDA